ncbi:hypothetical protein OJAV_G00109120 [Oryzias javanicus]|uniref:Uncharacterized protein n=1 Tax=Oryzias javanicus TaxID=123683 RepID=A0A437CUI5_ORYJA|nr:hypothetical protein OJAV_G00109120 [Oryzias javanicus]
MTSRTLAHLNNVLMELELQLASRFSSVHPEPRGLPRKRLSTMKTPLVHGIMVSHSEEDLLWIRAAFLKLTGNSLYSALQTHFKGEHLQALLGICRSED